MPKAPRLRLPDQETFSATELVLNLCSPESPIRLPANTFERVDKSHWTRDEVAAICAAAGYDVEKASARPAKDDKGKPPAAGPPKGTDG